MVEAVLLLGSGFRPWREYAMRGVAAKHAIWLFEEREPDWQLDYVDGASVLDLFNVDAVLGEARAVDAARGIRGLVCWDERLVEVAAVVSDALGLPTMSPSAVRACRDKGLARELMTRAGLPQPRSVPVGSEREAQQVAAELGYPVVVKPRNLGGSLGVVRADGPDAVQRAFAITAAARLPGVPTHSDVLIEQYLEGPEISVDGVVIGGRYRPAVLARKRLGELPYFEETGHFVDPEDELLAAPEVLSTLAAAHSALGIEHGLTHAEMRLTPHGPVVVEVNARLGGDLIPYIGGLASGIDLPGALVDLGLGKEPVLAPTHQRPMGIRFLYPPVDCVVRSVSLPEPGSLPGLLEAVQVTPDGGVIRLPPAAHVQRYGYLIATGADLQECDSRLQAAADIAKLEWDALGDA
jgi:biotin carboxylase